MSESHGLKGCSNHGCLVQPRPKVGMGTNAICRCLHHDDRLLAERLVIWLRSELATKDARITQLKYLLSLIGDRACEVAHHEKKHQHGDGDGRCPIEKMIEEALR